MSKTTCVSLRLLKIIKRFPELYKSRHDLANDKAHRMVVWDTISYELDTPVSVLKKEWQKLRSSYKKKCNKSTAFPPHDDIFHLMYSMLDAPGGDSPGDEDDSSGCSAPTLSIISEEDRSTRSSSTSTIVPEVIRIGVYPDRQEFLAQKSPTELLVERKSSSNRVLRSHLRTKRFGPLKTEELNNDHRYSKDSTSENVSISCTASENRENRFGRYTDRRNEPIRAFFESMALTVAKFPQHIQAATKTKICNVVVDAELQLSSAPVIR